VLLEFNPVQIVPRQSLAFKNFYYSEGAVKSEQDRSQDSLHEVRPVEISRRNFLRFLILSASVPIAGNLISACSPASPAATMVVGPTEAAPGSKSGGTIVLGCYQEAHTLNWILVGTPEAFATAQLYPMFEPLLRYNTQGALEPALLLEVPGVKNGGLSSDGKTYTLKMRPGVVWEDGTPCTLKDWKFTVDFLLDPKNNAVLTSGWKDIDSITLKDDHTAVVQMKKMYVPFIDECLAFWPLLPEHVQSKMSSEEFGKKPVGNGPFKFVEWVPGDHITLERNPKYWREQKALADKLIFKIVPDRNTVLAQVKTGDIDIGVDFTEAQIPTLQAVENINLSITPSSSYERYYFTMVEKDDITKPHPIFGDVKVRKAISIATDRQTVIDTVLHGKTEIAKNEEDNSPWENTNLKPYPFDPKQAKQLLDEAGWVPGADGIRVKDGLRLSFTHGTTAGNQTRETIQAMIQANLKDVGAEMLIRNEPASVFFGSFDTGKGYMAREYEWHGSTGGLASTDPNLEPLWHSREIPTKDNPNGFNISGLVNAELDALLDQQLTEIDPVKRKEILDKCQQIIYDEYPILPMYDRVSIHTFSKKIQGVKPIMPGGISGLMWNTSEWSKA
jgi:peptide/nickel transport system substrate-binding protein